MIIMGIDPGSRKAGYGVIEMQGRSLRYLSSGTLRYNTKTSFFDRLVSIYQSGEGLIEKYGPHHIAIETLIFAKNVSSLAKLAQARGALLAALSKPNSDSLFEYAPTQIKSAVSSDGRATKEGINKMVQLVLGKRSFETDDESDALAIAICHASLGAKLRSNNINR